MLVLKRIGRCAVGLFGGVQMSGLRMKDDIQLSTLLEEDKIQARVRELGRELSLKLRGKKVVAITVLNGAIVFFADLVRELDLDLQCEFLCVSSYHGGTKSSQQVKLVLDIATDISGQHILLIEDIIDTGYTMRYLQQMLRLRNPASITTVTFLHKVTGKKVECDIDHVGFSFKDDFVIGYGLDYCNRYRQLPYVAKVHLN